MPEAETEVAQPIRYTIRDAMNYKIGRFQFEKGLLVLETPEDVKEFEEEILPNIAVRIQRTITKTDYAMGAAIVAAHQAKLASAHQGGADSLTNRMQPDMSTVPGMGEKSPSPESAAIVNANPAPKAAAGGFQLKT